MSSSWPSAIPIDESDVGFIMRAYEFAAEKHRNQRRKNREQTPYINHPIRVANLLRVHGVTDRNVLAAALLHDTVEDTDATLEDISIVFGRHVASIVNEVTDDKSLPKHERKLLQIEHAPGKSTEAKLVKLADKLDNLRSLLDDPPVMWTMKYVQGYFVWAHAVIAGMRGTNAGLELQLDQVMASRFHFQPIPCTFPCIPEGEDHKKMLDEWIDVMKP